MCVGEINRFLDQLQPDARGYPSQEESGARCRSGNRVVPRCFEPKGGPHRYQRKALRVPGDPY